MRILWSVWLVLFSCWSLTGAITVLEFDEPGIYHLNRTTFNGSQSVLVEVWSAGGAAWYDNGGGGGAYVKAEVQPHGVLVVTVGQGGLDGENGTDSSVTGPFNIILHGGLGGKYGGHGGMIRMLMGCSRIYFKASGENGSPNQLCGHQIYHGTGGSAPFGGWGGDGESPKSYAGHGAPPGGGGGSALTEPLGNGAAGRVVFYF